MSAAILYVSSNKEDEGFEWHIRESLLKHCGDLPIISVSQKPMLLGKNICVGDSIGVSGFNMFKQILIGCKASDADFIISAEADCLYPPDYFNYRPPRLDKCYRNSNLYVMPDHRDYFFHKPGGATHSQVVGRKFYIETLERLFEGAPEWSLEEKNFPKERWGKADVFSSKEIEMYETTSPVIQIKTHRSMRYHTESERVPIPSLPYWGEGKVLRPQFIQSEVWKKI
jgi:hypothetical protein